LQGYLYLDFANLFDPQSFCRLSDLRQESDAVLVEADGPTRARAQC
jgi:hypothetical protein